MTVTLSPHVKGGRVLMIDSLNSTEIITIQQLQAFGLWTVSNFICKIVYSNTEDSFE